MNFVKTQSDLSQVFRNEVVIVEGESTLFDKIKLELEASEDWLINEIVGEATARELEAATPIFNYCITIAACDALRRAIPSLDLVLTPNGFGIVQNNNVVPASKERVERLIESCVIRRDFVIERLYKRLSKLDTWQSSKQRNNWASSPLQSFGLVDSWLKRKEYISNYDALKAMRKEATPFVAKLAERYISREVMQRISLAMCGKGESESDENDRLTCGRVANIVVRNLNGYPFLHQLIDPIVNYLRDVDEDWKASSVAELYSSPTFQNKKDSPGYFF